MIPPNSMPPAPPPFAPPLECGASAPPFQSPRHSPLIPATPILECGAPAPLSRSPRQEPTVPATLILECGAAAPLLRPTRFHNLFLPPLATARTPMPLLLPLRRHLLMRYLRLQLLILRRQIRILLCQRIHPPRQIRILLLQIRQLPLQLLILLPSLRVLTSRQRQSQTHRQQQNRYSIFPHSFSHSLGDWLRECPSVVSPSAPRNKHVRTSSLRLERQLGAAPSAFRGCGFRFDPTHITATLPSLAKIALRSRDSNST